MFFFSVLLSPPHRQLQLEKILQCVSTQKTPQQAISKFGVLKRVPRVTSHPLETATIRKITILSKGSFLLYTVSCSLMTLSRSLPADLSAHPLLSRRNTARCAFFPAIEFFRFPQHPKTLEYVKLGCKQSHNLRHLPYPLVDIITPVLIYQYIR